MSSSGSSEQQDDSDIEPDFSLNDLEGSATGIRCLKGLKRGNEGSKGEIQPGPSGNSLCVFNASAEVSTLIESDWK